MGNKTLIDGTSYKIKGGKTLINNTAYNLNYGITLINGVAHRINLYNWANDLDTGIKFSSPNSFKLTAPSPGWNGTLEYHNGSTEWEIWDGSEITSGI
jgi:hypothetical protein